MEADALKVVTIGEREYNIGRLSSDVGSFLLMRLVKQFRKMVAALEGEGEGEEQQQPELTDKEFSESLLQTLLTEMDFEDFKNLQRHALLVVTMTDFVGDKPFKQPIILRSGQFAVKELQNDIGAVMNLTSQTIFANLSPFFTKAGLKGIMTGNIPAFSQ